MGISDISKHSKSITRLYVAALLLGVALGFFTDLNFEFDTGSAIYELAWPLGGVIFGATWFGAGPVIALLVAGIYLGGLIESYVAAGGTIFIGGGAASSHLVTSTVDMARGSMEALAFLYGAVGGMYIGLHYAEIFDYGTSIDDTAKRNFLRKLAQGMAIALVAVGLRLIGV